MGGKARLSAPLRKAAGDLVDGTASAAGLAALVADAPTRCHSHPRAARNTGGETARACAARCSDPPPRPQRPQLRRWRPPPKGARARAEATQRAATLSRSAAPQPRRDTQASYVGVGEVRPRSAPERHQKRHENRRQSDPRATPDRPQSDPSLTANRLEIGLGSTPGRLPIDPRKTPDRHKTDPISTPDRPRRWTCGGPCPLHSRFQQHRMFHLCSSCGGLPRMSWLFSVLLFCGFPLRVSQEGLRETSSTSGCHKTGSCWLEACSSESPDFPNTCCFGTDTSGFSTARRAESNIYTLRAKHYTFLETTEFILSPEMQTFPMSLNTCSFL